MAGYFPAGALFLVTALYLAIAYTYKPIVRAFPAGVAWAMLGLVALDLLSRTRTRAGAAIMKSLNPAADTPPARQPLARQVSAVLWLGGFAALMVLGGVLVAVPIYLFAALARSGRRWWACGLGAAAATALLWVLFALVLRVALYPGLLFGGA